MSDELDLWVEDLAFNLIDLQNKIYELEGLLGEMKAILAAAELDEDSLQKARTMVDNSANSYDQLCNERDTLWSRLRSNPSLHNKITSTIADLDPAIANASQWLQQALKEDTVQ